MSQVVDTLLSRNESYLDKHVSRAAFPTMNTIVICCMDARIDPGHFLGVQPGEALVLRNAGGRVSLAVEQEIGLIIAMVSKMRGAPVRPQIVLVHHTHCGMEALARPELAQGLSEATKIDRDVVERLAICDHDSSLKDDFQHLKRSPHLPEGLAVTAIRYDEKSGRATVVFTDQT